MPPLNERPTPSQDFASKLVTKMPGELARSIEYRQNKIKRDPHIKNADHLRSEIHHLQVRLGELDRLAKKPSIDDVDKSLRYRQEKAKQLTPRQQKEADALATEIKVLKARKDELKKPKKNEHFESYEHFVFSLNLNEIKTEITRIKAHQTPLDKLAGNSRLAFLRRRREELQNLADKPTKRTIRGSLDHRNTLLQQLDPKEPKWKRTKLETEIRTLVETRKKIEKEGIVIGICENRNKPEFYSPKAKEKNARFTDKEEIPRYLNRHSQEYRSLIHAISEDVPQLTDQTEAVLALPAYKEGQNIYRTLSEYHKQTRRKKVAILIFDNRPAGTRSDNTAEEVNRFMKDHPDANIAYVKAQFREEARNIGNIRKICNDVMVELANERQKRNPNKQYRDLIMISNDADMKEDALKPDYFESILEFFHDSENTAVDAIGGKIDMPHDLLARLPLQTVGRRLWQYMDTVRRMKQRDGRPYLVGRNSAWKVSIYCAFGGYDANADCGEDTLIGNSILRLRNNNPISIRYLNKARLITSPRRDLMSIIDGQPIAYQYSDFKNSDKLRDYSLDELIDLAEGKPASRSRIVKEIEGLFYAFARKTDEDQHIFKRAAGLMGVKVRTYPGPDGKFKVQVLDISGLERGLKEQVFRELVQTRTETALNDKVKNVTPFMTGETNQVYKVELQSGKTVVVRTGRNAQLRYQTEKSVFERIGRRNIKTPKVLTVLTPTKDNPYAIQIMEYIPHTTSVPHPRELKNLPRRAYVLNQMGKYLKTAHQIPTNGWGTLGQDGRTSKEGFKNWGDFIVRNDSTSLVSRLKKSKFRAMKLDKTTEDMIIKAGRVLRSYKTEFDNVTSPRLVINDFSNGNMLMDGNGDIQALIDIEAPRSGDPMFDLAYYAFYNEDQVDLKPFYEGYGLTPDQINSPQFQKMKNLYQIRIALDLLWYSEWKQYTDKHALAITKLNQAVKRFSA